ncbi:hypothetical protein [Vibrio fluvialis]|uniref:hypothetical protein n=1 Tax=Vibrio fluvialis TaxID=676 RepID=UPI001302C432|nr:hypothetical protein [Vibrio fluvialis]
MIDKSALLEQGKHFGRIFLDFLCEHQDFANGRGGVRQELAEELLTIGQAEGLTEKANLTVTNIRNYRDGKHKIPYWMNLSSLILAAEKGFVVAHPADAIALVATVIVSYTDSKEISLLGMMLFIEQKYKVSIPDEYVPVVQAYLEARDYHLQDTQ